MIGRNLLASIRTAEDEREIVILNFSGQLESGIDSKLPITKTKQVIPGGEYSRSGWISGDVIFVARFMEAEGDTPQEYVFDAYTTLAKKEKLLCIPESRFTPEDPPESHSVEYIASRAKLYVATISGKESLLLSSWEFDQSELTATQICTNFFKDELRYELSIHPQAEFARISFRMIRRQVFCFVAFNANKLALLVADKKDNFSLLRIHELKQNRIFLLTSTVSKPCSFYSYKKISSDDDPYNTYQIYRLQLKF